MPLLLPLHFNPRSREGSDKNVVKNGVICDDFNPRSREGSDFLKFPVLLLMWISIHAPARGATYSMDKKLIGSRYFNPRSREGSDRAYDFYIAKYSNFNPRSREGSDG